MVTKRIKVYGIVQGVGMRPTVARHAASLGIKGSVSNLGPYVEIYAQGEDQNVGRFIDLMLRKKTFRNIRISASLRALRHRERYSYHLISQYAMSAFPNSLTGITGDICTRSSTAHAAGRGLRSWMRFLMTAREHR